MSQREIAGHHGSPNESTELHQWSGLAKNKKVKPEFNQALRSN